MGERTIKHEDYHTIRAGGRGQFCLRCERWLCEPCEGKGCGACKQTGLDEYRDRSGAAVMPDEPKEVDVLSKQQFDALLEYSSTLPSETAIGKKWKRRVQFYTGPRITATWYTGEYVPSTEPGMTGIKWRRVEIR